MGPPNHHHGLAGSISHTNRAHMARDSLKLRRAAESGLLRRVGAGSRPGEAGWTGPWRWQHEQVVTHAG